MSCSSSSGSEEDDEGMDSYRKGGYHAVRVGDQFASGRYIAQKKLGWGQFSTVWLAYDTQSSKYVALKIQKSAAQFAQAALHEIAILSAIADKDPSHSRCVVHLIDHFKHSGPNGQHPCMVLEFLGDSLLRLIKYNRYRGLEMNKVREICRCILIGLDYLHRDLGILHTDLKPENILLNTTIDATKDPIRSGTAPIIERPEGSGYTGVSMNLIEKKLKRRAKRAVAKISARRSPMGEAVAKSRRNMDGIDVKCKIVDFGNACWAEKPFAEEIQTRQYRAPEVVLQSGYSFSVDMWSFACTAFELATGDMLFTPKEGHGFSEDEDHLALMMELLGKIPKKIATGGASSKDFFDKYGDLKRIRRLKYWSLDQLLMDRYKFPEADAREFSEFLCPLLDFAPEKRPTAQQCLQHPWLQADDANQNETLNSKTSNNKTLDNKAENNKTLNPKPENNRTPNDKTLNPKPENNRTPNDKTLNPKPENNRTQNDKTLDNKTENNRTQNDKTLDNKAENNRTQNDKTQHEEEEHSVSRVGASVAKLEINQGLASESKVQKILNRYRKV